MMFFKEGMMHWCSKMMVAVSLMAVSGLALSDGKYLFELLENRSYRHAWDVLVGSQKQAPHWLADYSKSRNGPTTPAEIIVIDGHNYLSSMVCKTHNCGNNVFYVIFSPDGKRAWGRLLIDEENETLFGQPDDAMIMVLRQAG